MNRTYNNKWLGNVYLFKVFMKECKISYEKCVDVLF